MGAGALKLSLLTHLLLNKRILVVVKLQTIPFNYTKLFMSLQETSQLSRQAKQVVGEIKKTSDRSAGPSLIGSRSSKDNNQTKK